MFLSTLSHSQNENNIWYFGQTCGLDFNNQPPTLLFNSSMTEAYNYANISDSLGNLLCYTNGFTVWNKNHQIMEDGSINTGFTNVSDIIIVPFPGNKLKYYIIYLVDYGGDIYYLKYSIVDFSYHVGLGKVIQKDVIISTCKSPMIGCIKHQNNQDFWLLTKECLNENLPTKLSVFLMTNAGISSTPVSTITTCHSVGLSILPSMDGTKIVLYCVVSGTYPQNEVSVWSFNRVSGILTNDVTLDLSSFSSSYTNAIISPDNSKLYIPPYQYNLTAGSSSNIINSRIQIPFDIAESSGLQIMPDGKIYVFKYDEPYLDVINDPDSLGLKCNYVQNVIDLQGKNCFGNYPKYVMPITINQLSFKYTGSCTSNLVLFTVDNAANIQSSLWNFGDGLTSIELNPNYIYSNYGTYTVSLKVTYTGGQEQTITKKITISAKPNNATIIYKTN